MVIIVVVVFFYNFQIIQQAGLNRKISQMPVVLIPLHFDRDPANRTPSCCRSIVLRPFISNDFMTGVPAVPGSVQLPIHVSFNVIIFVFFF